MSEFNFTVPNQDVEATIHCAEWLILTGGSSYGEGRVQWDPNLSFQIAHLSAVDLLCLWSLQDEDMMVAVVFSNLKIKIGS